MLFGIICYVLGYLKEYEFKIFGDLNNLENELELKNGNVNWDFDICFDDLCNGFIACKNIMKLVQYLLMIKQVGYGAMV